MHCITQEKAEAIRADILAGLKNKEIVERQKCSNDTVTKQVKILADQGLITYTPRGEKKWSQMTEKQKKDWEKYAAPIRRYYTRLRHEQEAKKEPGEIKQIRLVPAQD